MRTIAQRLRRFRLLLGLLALGLGALAVFVWRVEVPSSLEVEPLATATVRDVRGEVLAEIASATARSQHPRPLGQLGEHLPRVTVALEDHRFASHGGVDLTAVAAAAWRNLRALRKLSGGSTITQQLIKKASGRPPRTLGNKLREAAAAWKLERRWGKDRLLARYLNTIDYGNRLLGAEAAARAYFGRGAAEITLAEAIYLAGLPQAPGRFNPWRRPAAAEYKYQRSLRRLAQLGLLDAEQLRSLSEHPPKPGRFLPTRRAPHFLDALLARAKADGTSLRGEVRTTLDLELQQPAEVLLRRHLDTLGRHDTTQAALVIIDNETGAVRALVGSRDYGGPEGQNNGATRRRSAGSALKPFIYASAIARGTITAATLLPDLPTAVRDIYTDYDPQNYSGRYLGPVRARYALGNSLNVPAVVVLERLGARQGFHELQRWGVRAEKAFDDYGAGFVLGNAEVSLLDLTAAFAGLARGGLAFERARLLGREDRVGPTEQVASPEACAIVTDILCDAQARRQTFGANSPLEVPVRVAVKTGTSSGFRDGWCIGYTARHTVGVWAGNFDGRPMDELLSVRSAGPLWRYLIDHLLNARRDAPIPPTEQLAPRLERVEICPLTGLRPVALGPEPPVEEWFLPGSAPSEDAAGWFVPDPQGGPARLLLPTQYADWCRSGANTRGAIARAPNGLAIASPLAGAVFVVDPHLSPAQQMLEFRALTADPRRVQWEIGGQPVPPDANGRVLWKLAPGEWEVTAREGDYRAVAKFVVE
ncbi:MAG: transglycosylase domain-containing protein [Verrucomicrobia bacterium]|nr:transglycosylase domain-containing protein [Verrucomicrobiota bacterium]